MPTMAQESARIMASLSAKVSVASLREAKVRHGVMGYGVEGGELCDGDVCRVCVYSRGGAVVRTSRCGGVGYEVMGMELWGIGYV